MEPKDLVFLRFKNQVLSGMYNNIIALAKEVLIGFQFGGGVRVLSPHANLTEMVNWAFNRAIENARTTGGSVEAAKNWFRYVSVPNQSWQNSACHEIFSAKGESETLGEKMVRLVDGAEALFYQVETDYKRWLQNSSS